MVLKSRQLPRYANVLYTEVEWQLNNYQYFPLIYLGKFKFQILEESPTNFKNKELGGNNMTAQWIFQATRQVIINVRMFVYIQIIKYIFSTNGYTQKIKFLKRYPHHKQQLL